MDQDHQDPPNYASLPSTATFLANRLNPDVGIDQIAHHVCVVCQDELEPNQIRRSGQTDDDDGNYTVVSVPPCNHIFHFHCIREWLHSNVLTRYHCPICRTPLCRRNVTSPAHVVEQLSRGHAGDPDWHPVRYEALLVYADEQVARQPLGDAADYCAIPRAVADWWYRNGNQTISSEHVRTGMQYIEFEVAMRVEDVLDSMDGVSVWCRSQLNDLLQGMTDAMEEQYEILLANYVDDSSDSTASDDSEDSDDSDEDDALDADGGADAPWNQNPYAGNQGAAALANDHHGLQLLLQAVEPDLQMPAPDVRTFEEHLQAIEDDHQPIAAEHHTIEERIQALDDSRRAAQMLVDYDADGDDEDEDEDIDMSDAE